MTRFNQALALVGSIGAAFAAGGCNTPSIIQGVAVQPSQDLSTITVSVEFASTIQSNLSGSYTVSDYGYLFVNPFSPTEPFELGFSLNTAIFNDQTYATFTPTSQLPNGDAIGVPYPLAQIQAATPISSQFNLYGYVDISQQSWLGAAAVFNFINNQYFPNGLSVSQSFLADSAGAPGVLVSVFGPTVNGSGQMTQAGGIAVFANVKQLLASGQLSPDHKTLLTPQRLPVVAGARAAEYQGRYSKLEALQQKLIRAFNQ